MDCNQIILNHVTYDVQRFFSGSTSIRSLLKERLRKEFPPPVPLTGQGERNYNTDSGSILSEEVL